MPPFRDPNRLFYDPANPVMLSADEISQLSPSELQAATDQLDQNMVLLLQRIEENFAQCNQLVIERLLPAVEQHGENSARIYESIKFWRPFFEASASIRLNEPYYDDSTSVATEETAQDASPDRTVSSEGDQTYTTTPSEDGTPRAPKNNHPVSVSDIPSEPQWSNDMSPFQSLQQEMAMPANSAMKQPPLPDMQRLRLRDLPPDSPDVPEPDFETVNVDAASGKGKGRSFDLSSDSSSPSFSALRGSPAPRNPKSGGGPHPQSALLEKILRKNLASPLAGPGSSTPGAGARGKLKFPHDLPQNWNGIANLSTTSLDAFPSPIKRRPSAMGEDDSFAPPSTIRHPGGAALTSSPAPRNPLASSASTLRRYPAPPSTAIASPAFSRTPAKEAARRTAQHVYDALDVDSPLLEPPSALKNPATMVYNPRSTYGGGPGPESPSERSTIRRTGATLGRAAGAGMSSVRSDAAYPDESYTSLPAQPSFVNASRTDVYDFSSSGRFGGAGVGRDDVPLSEFGGGTAGDIDDLLAGHTMTFQPTQPVDYAGIVDDEAVHDHGVEDESYTGEEGTEGYGQHHDHHQQQQQQRYDEDESFALDAGLAGPAGGRFAARLQDGPEDTLFGMPTTAQGGAGGGGGAGGRPSTRPPSRQLYEDDSFTDEEYGTKSDGSRFRLHGLSDMETLHGGELLASEPFQASPLAGRHGQYGQ